MNTAWCPNNREVTFTVPDPAFRDRYAKDEFLTLKMSACAMRRFQLGELNVSCSRLILSGKTRHMICKESLLALQEDHSCTQLVCCIQYLEKQRSLCNREIPSYPTVMTDIYTIHLTTDRESTIRSFRNRPATTWPSFGSLNTLLSARVCEPWQGTRAHVKL